MPRGFTWWPAARRRSAPVEPTGRTRVAGRPRVAAVPDAIEVAATLGYAPAVTVAAVGPELAQQQAMRGRVPVGLMAGAVNQGNLSGHGRRQAAADHRSPQIFVSHPTFEHSDPAVGIDSASQHLPGRVAPTVWDGEAGFTAPNQEPT